MPAPRLVNTFRASILCFVALLPLLCVATGGASTDPGPSAVCPDCHGNFASCNFGVTGTCIGIETVKGNAKIISEGAGKLSLTDVVAPRFLKMFSRSTLESLLSIIQRPQPGTQFEITKTTRVSTTLQAIGGGLLTIEGAVSQLSDLMEDARIANDESLASLLLSRLSFIKAGKEVSSHASGSNSIFDVGIFTYLWAKITEFVMQRGMQVHMMVGDSASTSVSSFKAKLHRPFRMEEFAEMLNLLILMLTGLGLIPALVSTDFIENCVYDTIRLRRKTWQVAHELLLIMFRRVEDSGGKLKLSTACDEVYLGTAMEEAVANADEFFRAPGGNPGRVGDDIDKSAKQWDGKSHNAGSQKVLQILECGYCSRG
jgi:hypothetical protein